MELSTSHGTVGDHGILGESPYKPVLYESMGSVWENGRVGVRRGPKAFAADCETGISKE